MTSVRLVFLLLCSTQLHAVAGRPDGLPESLYRNAVARGLAVYHVDEAASWADVVVQKSGKLARFGHDHIITVNKMQGFVMVGDNYTGSRADLLVPLVNLEVDPPERRSIYGLEKDVSESAKSGTRENMLQKVLEVPKWPILMIRTDGGPNQQTLRVQLSLHGIQKSFEVPVSLRYSEDDLQVEGTFTLAQSDYGIQPYSAFAGGLRVADNVEIHFRIVAKRYYFE
jgi:hypothetical protein